jgi:hypothetical protein
MRIELKKTLNQLKLHFPDTSIILRYIYNLNASEKLK